MVLGCSTAQAWAMMARERAELMPYVHQKQPQAVELGGPGGSGIPMVVIGMGPSVGPALEGEFREVDENQALNDMVPLEVSSPKSHD